MGINNTQIWNYKISIKIKLKGGTFKNRFIYNIQPFYDNIIISLRVPRNLRSSRKNNIILDKNLLLLT